jgi:predicted small secreted protein
MRRYARILLALAALVAAAPMLTACYTTRGAGEDLSAAGKKLSGSAEDHTNYRP